MRKLSQGERQRVALCRALLLKPPLLLCDEPTGNLDPDNSRVVLSHLSDFHKRGGTVVVASHSDLADGFADRVVEMRKGRIVGVSDS